MGSKVSKRKIANIKGVLEINGDKILVNVEDVYVPYVLSEYISEFDGLEVNISITHKVDEA